MKHLSLELLKCEHLNFDASTLEEIANVKVKHSDAINLEVFFKQYALEDEFHHRNRTYLVKDKFTGLAMGLFFQSYFTNLRFSNL